MCPGHTRSFFGAQANMAGKKKVGLAALSPERRKEIARLGGQAVQERGLGFRFKENDRKTKIAAAKGGRPRLKKNNPGK